MQTFQKAIGANSYACWSLWLDLKGKNSISYWGTDKEVAAFFHGARAQQQRNDKLSFLCFWLFLFFCPAGIRQSSVTAGAANVWGDRQRVVRGARQRRRDTPGAAGWMSAVGHAFPSSTVCYPKFSFNKAAVGSKINTDLKEKTGWKHDSFAYLFTVCLSGFLGVSWCVPVMKASSGIPLQV